MKTETATVDSQTSGATADAPAADPRVRTAVAFVVTHFPHIAETFVIREIDELERNGQPVVVVPLVRDDATVIHKEAKPWVQRALYTPVFSPAIAVSNLQSFFRSPLRYLGLLKTLILGTMIRPSTLVRTLAVFPKCVHLAEVLPRLGVKHIHAHFATHSTTAAFIISTLSDLTFSFTVHGPDVFVHRLLLPQKLRKAKFVRCVSTFNKAFLSGLYPALTEGKLEVVHTGLDPEVYAEAAAQSTRRKSDRPLLLSVASLNPRNGYPVLIDACSRLHAAGVDFECKIVGDGPLRDVTEAWIAKHGLADRVRILGNLPQHEVARLMGEADIFVLPSIIASDGQMDGIPVSLVEAMAAGKAVVASAVSGVPELVNHGLTGVLVDASHADRIFDAVTRLIRETDLRERVGRAAQQKVREQFHIRRTAAALINLFDRVDGDRATTAQRIASLNWSRLGVVAVGVRRMHEREDSVVAEVTISDGIRKRDVIVRQAREDESGTSPVERSRREFETLSVLRHNMGSEHEGDMTETVYSVPRLVMFDEPNAAIVVERADGKALAGLMHEARTRGRVHRLGVALRNTGRWLRLMQQHTRGDEDGRHTLTALVLLAMRDLDLAAAADRGIRRMRDSIVGRLRELESRLAATPLPVVGQHGEFRPENIFIGDRRVDVIDFGSYREGLPLEDVAQLLVHVELAFTGPLRRGYFESLRGELLRGFGGDTHDDALKLFTIAKALQSLAHCGDDLSPLSARGRRRALRRIITRSLS